MADRISPTPRNKLTGLLADFLGGAYDYAQRPDPTMPMGKANAVLSLLSDALPLKSAATVVDDLSYGQAPTRGAGMTTRLTPEATELALNALPFPRTAGKAALMGAGVVPGMEAAMFIGPTAKTWDKAAAATAQKLEKAGTDPRAIWSETGTFKGPDGKWRQEISDDAAKLRDYNHTPQEAFNRAIFNSAIGDGNHAQALAMRPYAGMTKNQLTSEYARTGGEIVDAALSGDKAKAVQLNADRAGLQDLLAAMRDRPAGPASSYLSHGELGQAYPDVYKLHTRITDEISPSRGAYLQRSPFMGEQIQLANKPRWREDKSTMLHELQHAIQQREGFARGGSPGSMPLILEDLAAQKRQEARSLFDLSSRNDPLDPGAIVKPGAKAKGLAAERQASDFDSMRSRLLSIGGEHEAYRRLAGEAEARATQARMNLTPDQRRATFPYDSYDVPVNQLIVRQDGLLGPQMAVLPGALDRARGLLGELAQGQRPQPIDIAELTAQQFSDLNAARKSRGQPEFTRPTVIYNGKHHYQSRSADGDSIDEMLLQIANSLDDQSSVVMSPRGPALQNPQSRVNPRGETVRDRAVLEGGGDRPTWLYSAIPKKKAP